MDGKRHQLRAHGLPVPCPQGVEERPEFVRAGADREPHDGSGLAIEMVEGFTAGPVKSRKRP